MLGPNDSNCPENNTFPDLKAYIIYETQFYSYSFFDEQKSNE